MGEAADCAERNRGVDAGMIVRVRHMTNASVIRIRTEKCFGSRPKVLFSRLSGFMGYGLLKLRLSACLVIRYENKSKGDTRSAGNGMVM